MKAKTNTLALSICILIATILPGKTTVTLQKAFDKKYIKAKAICKGGLELDYTISNLIKDSLLIILPAGWRFNSDGGKNDYQDILVTHEQILALKANEIKKFDLTGHCCEATKSGPAKGVPYTVGKMADSSLVLLARFLNTHPVDANTEQYSIWAISDKKETSHIASENDSVANLVRLFVAAIKGEPIPWYTLLKRAKITNLGTVYDVPVKFKADINFSVVNLCYAYCFIVDANGNKVSELRGQWFLPQNYDYKANFNIAGLKKGEYKLVVEGDKLPLFEKGFTI